MVLPTVGEPRPYHCIPCDVWGTGTTCWMCGSAARLRPGSPPFMPGGGHSYNPNATGAYVAGGLVHIDQ